MTEGWRGLHRFGFNSRGVDYVADNLANFRGRQVEHPERGRGGLVGVNLGKNKASEDPAGDYVIGVDKLGTYADYLVINVSSPNTPGAGVTAQRRLEICWKTPKAGFSQGRR